MVTRTVGIVGCKATTIDDGLPVWRPKHFSIHVSTISDCQLRADFFPSRAVALGSKMDLERVFGEGWIEVCFLHGRNK